MKRSATAEWKGTLQKGTGEMNVESGAFSVPFSFATRFGDEKGTNPEELIGAAHAGCYSMFLSAVLSNNEFPPNSVKTTATVTLGRDDTGPVVSNIDLVCRADVPGIDAEKFDEFAQLAKTNCPISRALAGPEISLDAQLV